MGRKLLLVFFLIVVAMLGRLCLFTVDRTEFVYVTEFGRHVVTLDGSHEDQAGLHLRWPWPVQSVLRTVSSFNDRVQQLMFRPNHLAPTYKDSQVLKPPRYNAYYDIKDVAPVDGTTWKLELAGLISQINGAWRHLRPLVGITLRQSRKRLRSMRLTFSNLAVH